MLQGELVHQLHARQELVEGGSTAWDVDERRREVSLHNTLRLQYNSTSVWVSLAIINIW